MINSKCQPIHISVLCVRLHKLNHCLRIIFVLRQKASGIFCNVLRENTKRNVEVLIKTERCVKILIKTERYVALIKANTVEQQATAKVESLQMSEGPSFRPSLRWFSKCNKRWENPKKTKSQKTLSLERKCQARV